MLISTPDEWDETHNMQRVHTRNGTVYDSAILQLYCYCFVRELHQESVAALVDVYCAKLSFIPH